MVVLAGEVPVADRTPSAADLAATVREALIGHWTSVTEQANEKHKALSSLDALLARCEEAERKLDSQSSIDRAYGWKARAEAAEQARDENLAGYIEERDRAEAAEARVAALTEALLHIEDAATRGKIEVEGITIDRPAFVAPNVAAHHLDAVRSIARAALADGGTS